jgi:hypothetical protein
VNGVLELLALIVFIVVGVWALIERQWMIALLAAGLVAFVITGSCAEIGMR